MMAGSVSRRSPLHDEHVKAGARLVPFAGWEMPVQYQGVGAEHRAVREHAGLFDVSHMGQVESWGPDAVMFLQRVLSNDIETVPIGGAQYSLICNEAGGVLDDVFTYRTAADRFLTVTNAANHDHDLRWLERHAGPFDVAVADRASEYAMLAVQGPAARRILSALANRDLPARMRVEAVTLAGVPCLVCGTGYTGEDGVEVLTAPGGAAVLRQELLAADVQPAGLGARDTLRLEVCFHLYGNDLTPDRDPIAAGLGWCCKEATGFIGSDRLAAVRERGPSETLVPFKLDGPGIARSGNLIAGGGIVTSGTLSPSLGLGIGMAYVPTSTATPGTPLRIDVRGKPREAIVSTRPLYQRPKD